MKKNSLIISLSFDDGRKDTYDYAYSIMKKYNLVGTLHVISGYIDNTWEVKGMDSSYGPCGVEMLQEMEQNGIEISLHGDKHTTSKDDLEVCIKKLKKWNLIDKDYGFSVPYSNERLLFSNDFQKHLKKSQLSYIRVGKNLKELSFLKKVYYVLYDITKIHFFYKNYNKINVNKLDDYDKMHLLSIPIKDNDKIINIKRFIKDNINSDKWLIFMFHSILPEENECYGKDKWAWSSKNFELLCQFLNQLKKDNKIKVLPIIKVVKGDLD